MSELIKCVMCGKPATHTAIDKYKSGAVKEFLCSNCKILDEQIRRTRGGSQYTE